MSLRECECPAIRRRACQSQRGGIRTRILRSRSNRCLHHRQIKSCSAAFKIAPGKAKTGEQAAAAIFALPTELPAVIRQARFELATEGSATYATGQGGEFIVVLQTCAGEQAKRVRTRCLHTTGPCKSGLRPRSAMQVHPA